MIRTAAALFAKKTAVVAVTGAVVLGGATLALAEGLPGEEPIDESELMEGLETPTCDEGETYDVDLGECVTDAPAPDGSGDDADACTDDLATPDVDECATGDDDDADLDGSGDDADACTDDLGTPDVDECATGDDDDSADLTTQDVDEDEVAGEHPENHGKYVSEAAQGGGECAGLTGRDKGQCVAKVARSDAGKPGAEAPAPEEEPAEEPAVEAEDEPAPAPKAPGKPDHAGAKGKGGDKQ